MYCDLIYILLWFNFNKCWEIRSKITHVDAKYIEVSATDFQFIASSSSYIRTYRGHLARPQTTNLVWERAENGDYETSASDP